MDRLASVGASEHWVSEEAGAHAYPVKLVDRNGGRLRSILRNRVVNGSVIGALLELSAGGCAFGMQNRRGLVISELQLCRLVLDEVAQRRGDGKSRLANLWIS